MRKTFLALACVGSLAAGSAASANIIDFDFTWDDTTLSGVQNINFSLFTQTFQYVADSAVGIQAGDLFIDRGYGNANSFKNAAGSNVTGQGGFLDNNSVGLIWDDLRGQVLSADLQSTGKTILNLEYTSVAPGGFSIWAAGPTDGFGQNYDGAVAHFTAGTELMTMGLRSGSNSTVTLREDGTFESGTFVFEFQVLTAEEGVWSVNGVDFNDLLFSEGSPTFQVTAFASAGTIQTPPPVTLFGLDADGDVFGGEFNNQVLFTETQSASSGDLRFAVPEPGTFALMGMALFVLGLLGLVRTRRREDGAGYPKAA